MKSSELDDLLEKVAAGEMSPEEAKRVLNGEIIKDILEVEKPETAAHGGCRY